MERVGSEMRYYDSQGVLVDEGDVIGFYVAPNPSPISMEYYLSSVVGREDTLFYMKDVDHPYCTLSMCNASMNGVRGVLPNVKFSGELEWIVCTQVFSDVSLCVHAMKPLCEWLP